MPDTALSSTSLILGRSLITAETIYQDVRERLTKSLAKMSHRASFQEALGMARKILSEAEPDFAEHLSQSDLAAWLAGFHWTSGQFPFWLNREFSLINEGPPKPPSGKLLWPWEEDQPIVRFPLLEKAAESLEQRGILSKAEFDQAAADIKLRSFTMAGDNTAAVLEEIRDAIAKDVQEGTSLRGFQEKFGEIVNASSLGPAHLETVYRTNVQSSFRDGRETLVSSPIVNEVFPYQEVLAIHDARARPEHLALETMGLSGTGIYRRADPFWDYFTGPWDYNCRCGSSLLTVADAAAKGVVEARIWMKTGEKPPLDSRLPFIPFRPKPGFGQRGRVVRTAA